MDYNSCLAYLCARGIADTKKTYREWTRKGHPDKGGNQEEFKQVRNCIEDVIKQDTWSCDTAPAAAAAGAGASAASVQAAFDAALAAAAFYMTRRSQPKPRRVSETFQELKTMFDPTTTLNNAALKYTPYTKYALSVQNRTNLEMRQVQNLFKSGEHAKAEEFIKEMQNRNASENADALRYFNALGVSWPEKLAKWPPAKAYNVPYDRSHPFLRTPLLETNSINSILMAMLPSRSVWTGGQYDPDFMQLAANNLLQTIVWARAQNHAWAQVYSFGRKEELWLDFFLDPTKWSSLSQWRKFQTWTASSNVDPNSIQQFPEVFVIQQEDIEYLQKLETERNQERLREEAERARNYERQRLRAEAERRANKRASSPVSGRAAAAAAGAGAAASRERSRSPERRKEIIDKAGLSRDAALDLFHLSKYKDETGWQLKLGSRGFWYFYQPDDRTKSFFAQELL